MGRGKLKAPLGQLRELRAARIRQPQELGALVEGLPGRIVAAGAQHAVATHAGRLDQQRVPAGHQQRQVRERRRIRFQERRQQMSFEVMHADRRHAPRVGEAARQRGAGKQRADEAGACGVGDPVELPGRGGGTLERQPHQGQQAPDVIARGELRHDAPVGAVQLHLAEELVREQPRARIQHRGGALVAGRLDGENSHAGGSHPPTSFPRGADSFIVSFD